MTMALRLLDVKRVHVMGNRGYGYSFPNWKRTRAIDHVPPYDYAPILSKAFFLLQRFPPPLHYKKKRNFNANAVFQGKCHLGVRKKGDAFTGCWLRFGKGLCNSWLDKEKKKKWPDRETSKCHKAIRIAEKGFYYFLGNVGVFVE